MNPSELAKKPWDPLWDERSADDWKNIVRASGKKSFNWLCAAIDNNKNDVVAIIVPLIEQIDPRFIGRSVYSGNETALEIALNHTPYELKKSWLSHNLAIAVARGHFQIMMRIYEECRSNEAIEINWRCAFLEAVSHRRLGFLEAISGWAKNDIVEEHLMSVIKQRTKKSEKHMPLWKHVVKFVVENRDRIASMFPSESSRAQFLAHCETLRMCKSVPSKPAAGLGDA